MVWIEGIGLMAGFLGILGWYPQVRRIWVDKRADGVSVPTFTLDRHFTHAVAYLRDINECDLDYRCQYCCVDNDNSDCLRGLENSIT